MEPMSNNLFFRKRIALFALLILTAACSASIRNPQSAIPNPPTLPYAADLQAALDRALLEGQGAHDLGISAAVIVPGYEPWLGVSGSSHPGVPLTTDMLFNMGSIAKSFEAALALQLAAEGALDLDQPISTWLPAYPRVDGRITPASSSTTPAASTTSSSIPISPGPVPASTMKKSGGQETICSQMPK